MRHEAAKWTLWPQTREPRKNREGDNWVHTKCTKFAFISTAHFFKRTPVCDLTACRGRFAQTNIGWKRLDRKPRFRIQTVALTHTTTNFCSVPIVVETWPRRNQIDGHAWNDNDWHRRRHLYVACKAHTTAKCFLGNSHCSPHLCELTMAVSQLLTPTNKHVVDVGNTITQTPHRLDSHALLQVDIYSRFMKLLAILADLLLELSWMLVDNHGSRSCRQPWFKVYTEVYQHLIMAICATSRTPNRQRVPRYSNCLV